MSDDRVIVRRAVETDCQPIAELLTEQILTGVAHFGTEPVTFDMAAEVFRETHERYPWLVAERGGQFLGFVRASRWKPRGAYDWAVETAVYIVSGARGQGIGRGLYGLLFETLSEQGFAVVIGGMTMPNDASEALHRAMGMSVVGDLDPVGFKNEQWWSVRYYQKTLRQLVSGETPTPTRPVSEVWPASRVETLRPS